VWRLSRLFFRSMCTAHWAPQAGRSFGSLLTYSSCARNVSVIGTLRRACSPPPPTPVCLGLGMGGMEGDGLCALTTPAQTRSVEKVTTRMRPNAREFMDPVSSKAWGCECILHSQHSASLLHMRSVIRSLIAIAIAAALFVAWRKVWRPRLMLREMGV